MKLKITHFLLLILAFMLSELAISAQREKTDQDNIQNNVLSQIVLETNIEGFNGKTFRLADSNAKARIIFVWAYWCTPCRSMYEELNKANSSFVENGVEILALSTDKQSPNRSKHFAEMAKTLADKLNSQFKNGFTDENLLKTFNENIPETLILSQDGKILAVFIGYNSTKTFASLIPTLNKEFSLKLKVPDTKKKTNSVFQF